MSLKTSKLSSKPDRLRLFLQFAKTSSAYKFDISRHAPYLLSVHLHNTQTTQLIYTISPKYPTYTTEPLQNALQKQVSIPRYLYDHTCSTPAICTVSIQTNRRIRPAVYSVLCTSAKFTEAHVKYVSHVGTVHMSHTLWHRVTCQTSLRMHACTEAYLHTVALCMIICCFFCVRFR